MQALGKPYDELLVENCLAILKCLIQQDQSGSECVALARELITAHKIEDVDVARVIRAIILREVQQSTSSPHLASTSVGDAENRFLTLLRLLNDSSVLGRQLLDMVKDSSGDTYPLPTVVELYIKAHECFTISSDIEGIAV